VKLFPVLITLFIIALAMLVYFVMEVMLFRISCVFARVPKPTIPRSIGIVLVVMGVVFVVEGILGTAVRAAYQAGGFPMWEAGLVAFFIGLPVHMAVTSWIHARMTDMPLSDGLAVWFVEKTIKLTVGLMALGFIALIVFSRK
jgi:multisubunit Na+/H+ antiporter MnhG subunit